MTCPVCGGNTKVTYTFDNEDNVVRIRRCTECDYKFRTIETDEDLYQRLEKGKENERDS